MIPLTTKLPAICSLLQRVLKMEEREITQGLWNCRRSFSGLVSIRSDDGLGTNVANMDLDPVTGTASSNCEFISTVRNITKPQATALLVSIEALKLTAWVTFDRRDESYLGQKAYAALQSIADAFPDSLFQDSSRCA